MLLTIFTPTYNRAYILPKLYKSLCVQIESNNLFEWLIIDDASSDNTLELVNKWKAERHSFEIRYYRQEHGGKHRALNKAFNLAKGEFIFIVDSDDSLTVDAVKLASQWISTIRNEPAFAGVSGLRISSTGKVWGGDVKYRNAYIDATNFERRKYNLLGDKAEVYRTSILKQYMFPEIPDEFFVTEDFCWMQIAAAGYKIRWYNHPIYICEYLEDGLTNAGANDVNGHIKNYHGYCAYIKKCLDLKPFSEKMLHLKEFNTMMKELKKPLLIRGNDIGLSAAAYVFLLLFCIPIAYLLRKARL